MCSAASDSFATYYGVMSCGKTGKSSNAARRSQTALSSLTIWVYRSLAVWHCTDQATVDLRRVSAQNGREMVMFLDTSAYGDYTWGLSRTALGGRNPRELSRS